MPVCHSAVSTSIGTQAPPASKRAPRLHRPQPHHTHIPPSRNALSLTQLAQREETLPTQGLGPFPATQGSVRASGKTEAPRNRGRRSADLSVLKPTSVWLQAQDLCTRPSCPLILTLLCMGQRPCHWSFHAVHSLSQSLSHLCNKSEWGVEPALGTGTEGSPAPSSSPCPWLSLRLHHSALESPPGGFTRGPANVCLESLWCRGWCGHSNPAALGSTQLGSHHIRDWAQPRAGEGIEAHPEEVPGWMGYRGQGHRRQRSCDSSFRRGPGRCVTVMGTVEQQQVTLPGPCGHV